MSPIMLCSIVVSFCKFFSWKTFGVSIYIFCNDWISKEACELSRETLKFVTKAPSSLWHIPRYEYGNWAIFLIFVQSENCLTENWKKTRQSSYNFLIIKWNVHCAGSSTAIPYWSWMLENVSHRQKKSYLRCPNAQDKFEPRTYMSQKVLCGPYLSLLMSRRCDCLILDRSTWGLIKTSVLVLEPAFPLRLLFLLKTIGWMRLVWDRDNRKRTI
jgi:hypothetical protein